MGKANDIIYIKGSLRLSTPKKNTETEPWFSPYKEHMLCKQQLPG